MKRSIVMTLAIIALSIHPSFADGVNPHTHDQATGVKNVAVIDVPAAAKDAVATVDRFSAALSAGDLAKAGKELDPKVLILESGGAERSAVEYLGGHAKGDAAFLKTAHQQLGAAVPTRAVTSPGWRAKASCTCRKTASR